MTEMTAMHVAFSLLTVVVFFLSQHFFSEIQSLRDEIQELRSKHGTEIARMRKYE